MLIRVYNFSAVAVCMFKWPMVDLLQKQGWLIWLPIAVFHCGRLKGKGDMEVQCKYTRWKV